MKAPGLTKPDSLQKSSGLAHISAPKPLNLQIKTWKDFRALHHEPLKGLKDADNLVKVKY